MLDNKCSHVIIGGDLQFLLLLMAHQRKPTLKKVQRKCSSTEQQNVEQRQYEWIGEGTLRDGAKLYKTSTN